MEIKNSGCFDNMGRQVIGDIPSSLIVVSALSVALSLLIVFLISSIRIKDSIVSDFRLEEDWPSLYRTYDYVKNEKGNNIKTEIRIPITRVNDVTVGLPVLLSFDLSPGSPAYSIIGYVKGVDFRVEQPLTREEISVLASVSLDESHINIQDNSIIIGKTGKAELIISDNLLGSIIIGSFIDHLPQRY